MNVCKFFFTPHALAPKWWYSSKSGSLFSHSWIGHADGHSYKWLQKSKLLFFQCTQFKKQMLLFHLNFDKFNKIVVLTETWLNETNFYPHKFVSPKHKFYSKSRSSNTGVNKGWGCCHLGSWGHIFKTAKWSKCTHWKLFESLWVEISGLSVNKILINASYCPDKILWNNFIVELTSETSSAYSITDEVSIFGGYNTNYFNKKSTLLDEFSNISGLTISNTEKPTPATSQGETLIDHGFSSKN